MEKERKSPLLYIFSRLIFSAVLLPALASVIFFGASLLTDAASLPKDFQISLTVTGIFSWLTGFLLSRKAHLPEGAAARLLPVSLSYLVSLLLIVGGILLEDFNGVSPAVAEGSAITINISAILAFLTMVFSGAPQWGIFGYITAVHLPFILAVLFYGRKRPVKTGKKGLWATALCAVFLLGIAVRHFAAEEARTLREFPGKNEYLSHDVEEWRYRPFKKDNKLILPDTPPALRITENHPRLDGAIAVYPMYAGMAQAVYKGLTEEKANVIVRCRNTPEAYQALIAGDVDIFIGAQPSKEQKQAAHDKGLEFTLTPVAKEAFVFFVHRDNLVKSLTVEQIQDIYTRKISDWKEVGGNAARILAFQRNQGSGSQTVMEAKVMQGKTMSRPLQEEHAGGMGGIVRGVAEYRNRQEALGYSFRWYITALNPNTRDVSLLAINGVEPTPENIRNKNYPFTVNVYAVTARPRSAETEKLIGWMLSSEGQEYIEKNGYVPLQ